jgi:hypothetical protein
MKKRFVLNMNCIKGHVTAVKTATMTQLLKRLRRDNIFSVNMPVDGIASDICMLLPCSELEFGVFGSVDAHLVIEHCRAQRMCDECCHSLMREKSDSTIKKKTA